MRFFFHGTTDRFLESILDHGLRPTIFTGIRCENRKTNLDKVFLTDNPTHAKGYALRAALKHGGKPIVLHVKGLATLERKGRVNQYVTDKADVLSWETYDRNNLIDDMLECFQQ